jgi:RsiW-degrading membrane proteinase PrsW (M82 family)
MVLLYILATAVPTLIYITLLWWLDRYEKEPWPLFLSAFAYGCVPAIILSIILELMAGGGEAAGTVIVAPIVEEAVKGLAVLLIFLIWRHEFDNVLDGIIYGAVVGLGFAMVENVFYFVQTSGDMAVILMRTLLFGLNHAFFTAFTGAFLGIARQSRRKGSWVIMFPIGLAIAMFFHALHNFSTSMLSCAGLGIAVVADWAGVIVIIAVAIASLRKERRWIQDELGEEVAAGLLADADRQALLSASRRIGARMWMLRTHGWTAFRLLGRYFHVATELAFRKHDLRSGTGAKDIELKVEALRRRVQELRGALLARMGAE